MVNTKFNYYEDTLYMVLVKYSVVARPNNLLDFIVFGVVYKRKNSQK